MFLSSNYYIKRNFMKMIYVCLLNISNYSPNDRSGVQYCVARWKITMCNTECKLSKAALQVFIRKSVLKICSKFTKKHLRRSVICNFIEITLRHGYSAVDLLHSFRTAFLKNTSKGLPLSFVYKKLATV